VASDGESGEGAPAWESRRGADVVDGRRVLREKSEYLLRLGDQRQMGMVKVKIHGWPSGRWLDSLARLD
jgi:hypothetical protein